MICPTAPPLGNPGPAGPCEPVAPVGPVAPVAPVSPVSPLGIPKDNTPLEYSTVALAKGGKVEATAVKS